MSTARILSAVVIASSLTLTGMLAPAATPASEPLFEQAPAVRGASASASRRGAIAGKSRQVRTNRAALGRGRLQLNLGVGPTLDAVRERLVEHGKGRRAWIGRVNGDPDSEVILYSSGQAVAGSIRHQGRLYKLQPGQGGVQRLEEVSPGDPLPSTEMVPDLPASLPAAAAAEAAAEPVDATNIIDLLVGYTPEAKAAYGDDGIEALIGLAVEETNQAFLNSNAPVQLRLVATTETAYHDSGDMAADLTRATTANDGYLDELLTLRDSVGADIVSLVVNAGNYCGVSWQMGVLHPAYAGYAFNVVKASCATGYYSFGHELGHNLGLSHDHANASYGVFPYSYGWQEPSNHFRTVMAYDCTTGCTRVQHFSNPEIAYADAPTGQVGWADNALALEDSAPLVATWRASQLPALPAAPGELTATASGYDRIDLSWQDLADNEDGYQIERSADGENYSLIATLAADSDAFADQPLTPETSWFYRVSAVNGAGVSPASNDAWATTEPAPIPVPQAPSDLSATVLSHTEIALSWNDQSSDETGFELERSLDNGASWDLLVSLGAEVTDYTDQALAAASTYSYRVRAAGAGDASDYSNSVTATTEPEPLYPPAAPSDLDAHSLSTAEIALNWTDQAADETAYELERSEDGGMNWTPVAALAADAIAHTDSGLDAGSFYLYRVRAIGNGGASDYSNQAGAETQAEASACAAAGADRLILADKTTGWAITNTGSLDLTLSAIEISWPAGQQVLAKIKLDGDEIWRGFALPTSATIDSGWNSRASRRVLPIGQSAVLLFQFSGKYKTDTDSDYSITLHFSEGCSLQF